MIGGCILPCKYQEVFVGRYRGINSIEIYYILTMCMFLRGLNLSDCIIDMELG